MNDRGMYRVVTDTKMPRFATDEFLIDIVSCNVCMENVSPQLQKPLVEELVVYKIFSNL